MALFLIGLLINVAIIVCLILTLKKFVNVSETKVSGNTKYILLGTTLALGLTNILSSYGLAKMNEWTFTTSENLLVIFGSLMFGISIALFINSFGLYYYKSNFDLKQKKISRILIFVSAFLCLLGLWLFSEGIANQDIYPLINGVNTAEGFTIPHVRYPEGLTIRWYGIVIVFGALICYFITDHETYKKFGEHGLIDTLFIFAFLCGLIGSRLWFCLILEPGEFLNDPITIFTKITDGGLAIQGGAIFGMAGGIIFVLLFRKYIDVRFLMDVAIPSILIAQAIGRWGNFFNQEVYGGIAPDWMVNMLPTIVKNNMFITTIVDGEIIQAYRVPLFLIESLINIGGFCLIRFVFGRMKIFQFGKGCQASLYLVWYGLVRVVMEPLRDGYTTTVGHSEAFGYQQSWIVAFIMIGLGILLFLAMYLLHKIRMEKGLEDENGDKIKAKA